MKCLIVGEITGVFTIATDNEDKYQIAAGTFMLVRLGIWCAIYCIQSTASL
jgi:hypothetical protein